MGRFGFGRLRFRGRVAPPAAGAHPRLLVDADGLTALRSELASDATFRTRWQTAIDQFEDAAGRWTTVPADAFANAFAAFLAMVRRSDNDLGLTWSFTWQEYRDAVVSAAQGWTNIGGGGGASMRNAIAVAIVYDCLYDDLTAQERTDLHDLIETGFAAGTYLGAGVEVWDNGGSDDHFAKLFCALASESYQSLFDTAALWTMRVVDTNDWMGYGFGVGREFHKEFPSRQGLPMALLALKHASDGEYTDADTMDHFLIHLRDAGQLVQHAIIPHPSATSDPGKYWVTDKFHTQDVIKFFHRQLNAAAYLVNALGFLPGKVDLDATGMSDQATLADSEEEFFRYLWGVLDEANPVSGTKLRDVLNFADLGEPEDGGEDGPFWVFPAWLIHNAPDYSASTLSRADAGIPSVRRWWPGTLEWTFYESPSFSRTSGTVIRYRHRRYAASPFEEGTRTNGSWTLHRDGPLLVQGGETGHGVTGGSMTWAANGCVSFLDYTLYDEFTWPPINDVDGGGQRAFTDTGRYESQILAASNLDYGRVVSWYADADCIAISSDLTRSYNSTPVQTPSALTGNEKKIDAFTREFVIVRRGADGGTSEKVFTYDRIALLDTAFTPLYHLCPAADPDIDGTESEHTPAAPSSIPDGQNPAEVWTATGPTRWDYSGATRLIFDNTVEPDAPTPGNGKVQVTWLEPASPVVRKMSGLNAVSAGEPTGSGTPGMNPWNGWVPKADWASVDDLEKRAYVGVYTVSIAPSDVAAWDTAGGHFLVACEVMAASDTPATAASLTCDAGSAAARCGASAVVFSESDTGHTSGNVDIPSGVTLVMFVNLSPGATYTLSATGGLSITTAGPYVASAGDAVSGMANTYGRLVVEVSGGGNLAWS